MTPEASDLGRSDLASRTPWTALRRLISRHLQAALLRVNDHGAKRYAVAVALVAGALGIGLLLQLWDDRVTLFPFYAAVVGSAWLGTGPGYLAVALSVITVQYFFTPPDWSFEVTPQDVPFMAAFIVCAAM